MRFLFLEVLLRGCWMQAVEACMDDGHATVCTCKTDLCNSSSLLNNNPLASIFGVVVYSLTSLLCSQIAAHSSYIIQRVCNCQQNGYYITISISVMEVFWTSQHRECKYGGKLRNMIMCIYRQIYQTKRAIIFRGLKR